MSTPFRLQVPRQIYEDMLEQARSELPNECCGFLAGQVVAGDPGRVGRVLRRYPLVNTANDPTRRYEADVKSLFEAHRDLRERGLVEVAIYHSHPTSDPIPSRIDLERSYWPGVVSLIISLRSAEPHVRAWWLTDLDFQEAEWELVPEED